MKSRRRASPRAMSATRCKRASASIALQENAQFQWVSWRRVIALVAGVEAMVKRQPYQAKDGAAATRAFTAHHWRAWKPVV